MKICEAIADMMHTEYHEPQSIKQNEVEQLAAAISELQNLLKTNNDELTQTEIDNCTLQSKVGNAITLRLHQTIAPTSSTDPHDKASFDDSIHCIQDWLNDTAKQQTEYSCDHSIKILGETSIAPSWQYLHSAFSTLESLQFIALLLALSHTKPSKSKSKSKSKNPLLVLPPDQRKRMLDLVLQIESSIHDSARTLKANLNASGVLGRMIDVVFGKGGDDNAGVGALGAVSGKELEKLPDAETVAEGFCGEVKESWEDALEGIMGVRVRRWK
jgi:N-terminal acetyltransferase B complex non-catalytic subunit